MTTEIKTFNRTHWATQALASQTACNTSGLLHSASRCLTEWRDSGGDRDGKECLPLRFLLLQVAFLTGLPTDYPMADYSRDTRILEAWAKGEEA